jgi:hypothetical protein
MSYLRGPLTRDQIAVLMAARRAPQEAAAPSAGTSSAATGAYAAPITTGSDESTVMPQIAGGVGVRWVDPAAPWVEAVGGDPRGARLEAAVVARVSLRYDETKADLVHDQEYEAVLFPLERQVDVTRVEAVDYDDRDLRDAPAGGQAVYRLVDAPVDEKPFWTALERDLVDHLVRSAALEISTNRELKLFSRPGETPDAFASRCASAADEAADADAAALRDKYESRAKRLQDQIAKASDRIELLAEQQKGRRSEELLSTAGSILGGLLGGKRNTRRLAGSILGTLGGAAGRRSRTSQAGTRLDSAKDQLDQLHDDLEDLEAELAAELDEITRTWDAKAAAVETLAVPLERADVKVTQLVLAWLPVR